ncbi:MAG: hypothetical protein JNJ56_02080 [Ignavibacteria bacterium]|nr:hypothetical protein [Ignavibacteria bacterium]
MKIRCLFLFAVFICSESAFTPDNAFSQAELIDIKNPVYSFLKRMELMKIIPGYDSYNIPYSRKEVAVYLLEIEKSSGKITETDRKLFRDYKTEFEFDMYGKTDMQYSLISGDNAGNIFSNTKEKNLFYYTDSSAALFTDAFGSVSQRGSYGDSIPDNSEFQGNYGIEARGTLFGSVGFFIALNNSCNNKVNDSALNLIAANDPVYRQSRYFISEDNSVPFEGYLRYQTNADWLSLDFGRYRFTQGKSYIDNLFFSGKALPFDFGRLQLKYKSLNYSFTYGSLRGDSVGRPLSAKNVSSHYLNMNFSDAFRLGLWEAVIISNQPFSFTYFNPVSFLTSADLSSGREKTSENNSLMGIDIEIIPAKNISFQSSLLIDDLTFGTLFETDSLNENKFGWQFGFLWTNSLNMNIAAEYTHLDPFVYSHRSNKSTYTNNTFSLGHTLPPNSDEIALKLNYDITNRINIGVLYRHQRSGTGIILDSSGKLEANYGGNINFGLGDAYLRTNGFLDGIRINRDIFSFSFLWQPVKQFYLKGMFQYNISDNLTYNYITKESFYYLTFLIDI